MRLIAAAVCAWLLLAGPVAAQQPLGVIDGTLARFDPDTLAPAGPTIEANETHTVPVLSPDGSRFAVGVSESGGPGGRVGLWIGDPVRPAITHRIQAGIVAEAVVFPGVVGALLQDGKLIVVDPETGAITRTRRVGWSFCARGGVHVAGRGVIVNEIRSNGAEVAIIDPRGRVSTRFVRLRPAARRCVALVADGDRAYIIGRDRVAALDPVTRAVTTHPVRGRPTTAATVPQGLVVAGAGGARLYDAATWRARWHDRRARSVLASGNTVGASGDGVRALDAASGHVLWRAPGSAAAVAADRVYAQPAALDLNTGERRGTHPVPDTRIRLVDIPERARTSQADWPFERLTETSENDDFELQGPTIYTRSDGPSVTAHPGGRRFRLPRGTQAIDLIRATPKALMVFVAGPGWRVLYGPRDGPLKRHRKFWTVAAAVTGSTLLTVERDQRWIYKRDVNGGPLRRLARVGRELTYMQAAGHYVAVVTEQKRLVVVDVRSGRTVYRVRFNGFYRPSGAISYRLVSIHAGTLRSRARTTVFTIAP